MENRNRGTLRDLALDDAALPASSPRNVVVEVRGGRTTPVNCRCEIGQITHARTTNAEGKAQRS
jgi:hypothetical protein